MKVERQSDDMHENFCLGFVHKLCKAFQRLNEKIILKIDKPVKKD